MIFIRFFDNIKELYKTKRMELDGLFLFPFYGIEQFFIFSIELEIFVLDCSYPDSNL